MIIDQAVDPANSSKLCSATIDLFVSILASEAGNLALKFLATGGVYLAGGVAVHTLPMILAPGLPPAFQAQRTFWGT